MLFHDFHRQPVETACARALTCLLRRWFALPAAFLPWNRDQLFFLIWLFGSVALMPKKNCLLLSSSLRAMAAGEWMNQFFSNDGHQMWMLDKVRNHLIDRPRRFLFGCRWRHRLFTFFRRNGNQRDRCFVVVFVHQRCWPSRVGRFLSWWRDLRLGLSHMPPCFLSTCVFFSLVESSSSIFSFFSPFFLSVIYFYSIRSFPRVTHTDFFSIYFLDFVLIF